MTQRPSLEKAFAEADWNVLLPALLTHAHRRLARVGMSEGRRKKPAAAEAQEMVNDAIELALSGKRVWPDDIDFETYLKGLIWTVVSTMKRARTTRAQVKLKEDLASGAPTPDRLAEKRRLLDDIRTLVEDDPELTALIDALDEGHEKRAAIAEALGWSVERVTLARTKLNRRLAAADLTFGEES